VCYTFHVTRECKTYIAHITVFHDVTSCTDVKANIFSPLSFVRTMMDMYSSGTLIPVYELQAVTSHECRL